MLEDFGSMERVIQYHSR